MTTIDGINIYGDPIDDGALRQIKVCDQTAEISCLMADHHQGYAMPIGGVCAYTDKISPAGVGFDIACGNKAVLTDARADSVIQNIGTIMDDVAKFISFGVGLNNQETVDHELFDDDAWSQVDFLKSQQMKALARNQLGTVGSGNHYVDIFVDELDRIWVGVHFGSRGFGHKTASHFLKEAGAKDAIDAEPVLLDVDSAIGSDYLAAMNLAGRYAYAGRDWVCQRVVEILGAHTLQEVHNHHNFAWKEMHKGKEYWVVRKGATPAFPGQLGFVGGSMGENSVIVKGVESQESADILYSTIHGAGRTMSRTQAAGKMNYKTRTRSGGEVTPEMMHKWVSDSGVELRGAGVDESPHCYKRLHEVLKHHKGTIEVLHTLKPIGVAMAGANEYDPYKD